jgi:amidase
MNMKTAAERILSQFSPAYAPAAEMAAAIRRRTISATELLALTFQRIDRHNSELNAIVWQCRDEAMARAKDADQALVKGRATGPLHGVPITVKEAFAYRGSPNTWGLPPLKSAMSPRTAIAIERLESAGAIIVGKTNVPVMLGDWQTYNPVYGGTNNPWDVSRTPGGSTGGGAAAVASGLGALTLGSDLSGSIRIPAHFCGVYGHKPSLGLVSMAGFQPGPWDGAPGPLMDLAVIGPMARSAHDLGLALDVLGGPTGEDANAWTWRLPAPRHRRLKDFRIGYVMEDPIAPIASDIRNQYDNALAALSAAGARMERGWPPGLDLAGAARTYGYLLMSFVTADLTQEDGSKPPHGRADKATASTFDHARWLRETQRRLVCRATWQRYFESHDVFLLPSSFTAAFPHDHSEPMGKRVIDTPEGVRPYVQDAPYWISTPTLAGLPATVAPVELTDAGLPVGIQIVAPMWEDGTSIEFAALLSEVIGGFKAPRAFPG